MKTELLNYFLKGSRNATISTWKSKRNQQSTTHIYKWNVGSHEKQKEQHRKWNLCFSK